MDWMSFVINVIRTGMIIFAGKLLYLSYCLLSKIQTLPILNLLSKREKEKKVVVQLICDWLNTHLSVGLCLKTNNFPCVPYSTVVPSAHQSLVKG